MSEADQATYPPINTLKRVADDVWIVDGPMIRFGPPLMKMPFSTRMTVLRLQAGLFIHSPTPLVASLRQEIAHLGAPRWIVGPNRIHYWWIPDWRTAYPDAEVYLAPRIAEQAKGRIDFPAHTLERRDGYPWDDEVATLPIVGSYMTEVEFFHRASWTLILTDAIENFEARKLPSRWMRWMTRMAGVADPNGSMPVDMRMTYRAHRSELRAAVEAMIAWNPERVILAHGRWLERDGAAELKRAFRWLLR
jgi:hypothetical protein